MDLPAALRHLTPAERVALVEFLQAVRARLGSHVLEARVFGSRARGEGSAESDLDVALVVTREGRERRREIHDLAFDALLRYGVDVAPLVIEQARLFELQQRERRLAADLATEGISV